MVGSLFIGRHLSARARSQSENHPGLRTDPQPRIQCQSTNAVRGIRFHLLERESLNVMNIMNSTLGIVYATNRFGERLEQVGGIICNLDYWDCECAVDYIHPEREAECPHCGAFYTDMPPARENEVEEWRSKLTAYLPL